MRCEERIGNPEKMWQNKTVCLHSYSDLSHVSPAVFVYLLKECYVHGTRKATLKFRALQQQVLQALHNAPQPGPAAFIVQCLYILPLLGSLYTEGFSHLLISSLRRLQNLQKLPIYSPEAKRLAVKLFLDALACFVVHEERILIKLLEIFDIGLEDIGEVICGSEVNGSDLDMAKACVEQYIFGFIESQSYMTAVSLLERFSIRQSGQSGQSFLLKMLEDHQYIAAEKWATFMGKPMLCVLVQKYIDMKKSKNAYDERYFVIKFHDAFGHYDDDNVGYKKKKGILNVCSGYTEKVDELCERLVLIILVGVFYFVVDHLIIHYSLSPKVGSTSETKASSPNTRYLHLTELGIEDIIWVDKVDVLLNATIHMEGCKVVGIDCEWKPNYVKGSKPNKVSIMQIASERKVFIIDLLKLSTDEPNVLDSCLKRILSSPRILKLGYNLQCDLQQLSLSYGDLECFKYYEMLLDIQKLFKQQKGGLSGLAKKILGAGLNKTRRNSNWEQRPLSQNQMEYAALDAAVLIHIFHHLHGHPQYAGNIKEEQTKVGWKSHIVSRMGNTKILAKASS
ncbi:3'-5' exonuclease domain-containing protein [Cinnamomum micranthum f. kanehirae]|uniref:3'-5' exonuclease domain-containing protein n=1 Tax=Cinnamomum micranthum f. kanehirae TaxID=337451 RepID=A0A3S3NFS9_9MAGN|nr:3'-5' exonuclease domain-containing protein [Cinnamomum micranthum f. kanehirae]